MGQPNTTNQHSAGQVAYTRTFEGMSTQSYPTGIKDSQFSWLENIMPIGNGNLKVLPGPSAVLATLAGSVIDSAYFGEIGTTPYIALFTTAGGGWSFNVNTNALVRFAADGTFSGSGVTACMWKAERFLILDTNNGFWDWDGTTLTNDSGSVLGTAITSFSGRVWVANGRTIRYSDVNSYNNFASGASGSFILTDTALTGNITDLKGALNNLWIYTINGINVVNGVAVVSGITTFSNTNISTTAGTDIRNANSSFFRAMMMVSRYGIYSLFGVTPLKVSDDLDGLFTLIDFSLPVSSGLVTLYNISCFVACATYNDPVAGARKLLMLFFNNRWFVASQGTALKQIVTVPQSSSFALYAHDGTHIYKLFSDTTTPQTFTATTKLFDFNKPMIEKEAIKAAFEINAPVAPTSLMLTVITENQSVSQSIAQGNSLIFVNNSGLQITFTGLGGLPINWVTTGYIINSTDASIFGYYLGLQFSGQLTPGTAILGHMLQYNLRNIV